MTLPTDLSHDRVVNALRKAGFAIREGAKHTLGRKATLSDYPKTSENPLEYFGPHS